MFTRYPISTFQKIMKECYIKYNTNDYNKILEKLLEENPKFKIREYK